jgi:hypothetical protein
MSRSIGQSLWKRSALLVAGLFALSSTASAGTSPYDDFDFGDIANWTGQGSNQAALVIDFQSPSGPSSYVWGYRWNGTATGEDMLNAIAGTVLIRDRDGGPVLDTLYGTDPRLYARESSFGAGLGRSVFGLGYDKDGDGGSFVSGYENSEDGHTTDADDLYAEGWFTGYWGYYVHDTEPGWGFSALGMSSRELTDGSWDGWGFGAGFNTVEPALPSAAAVAPEPVSAAMLIAGAAMLRRRRRAVAVGMAGATLLTGASANATYLYNPNDFAVQVVSSTGLAANSLYSDPAAVLGRPALKFNNNTIANPQFRRVKLVEPAFNTGLNNERLITTFNAGQAVTVKMGRKVYNDPANPYGIDLNVFGNAFFVAGGGGFVSDATNLNTATVGGGIFDEPVRVSVSPDNVNWYTYVNGPTGDGLFPTNSYFWNRSTASWTDVETDPTKPVDPSITLASLAGKTDANVLDLYKGSAGGTGFDLAESGFAWIEYVKFEGLTGFSGGEIDAVAAVNPEAVTPEPATLAVTGSTALLIGRRRRV